MDKKATSPLGVEVSNPNRLNTSGFLPGRQYNEYLEMKRVEFKVYDPPLDAWVRRTFGMVRTEVYNKFFQSLHITRKDLAEFVHDWHLIMFEADIPIQTTYQLDKVRATIIEYYQIMFKNVRKHVEGYLVVDRNNWCGQWLMEHMLKELRSRLIDLSDIEDLTL